MRDGRLGVVVERLARGHVEDAGSAFAGVALIAPDRVGTDAGDGAVALEVGRCSDVLPVGGVADAWEGVCVVPYVCQSGV